MIKLSDRKTTWKVGFFQPPPLGLTCPDKWMNIRQRNHKTKKGRVQSYLVVQKTCFFLVWGFRGTGVYCIKVDCNYNDFLFFIQALEFQYPQVSFPRIFLHRSMQQMLVEFNNLQVTNPSMKSSKGSNAHDDGGIVQWGQRDGRARVERAWKSQLLVNHAKPI